METQRQPPKERRSMTGLGVLLLFIVAAGGFVTYVMLGFLKAFGCALMLGMGDGC